MPTPSRQKEWFKVRHDRIALLERDISALEPLVEILSHKKIDLAKTKAELRNGRSFTSRGSDLVYVRSKDLVVYILRWKKDNHRGNRVLAERSGVSSRTIERIINHKYEFTTYTIADALFTGMGIGQVLNTLETFSRKVVNGFVPEPPPSKYYEE